MTTVPFVPATCILLPATGCGNLLQQLTSLLGKPTTSANTTTVPVGQGNPMLQIITSGIPQSASTTGAKAGVSGSNPTSSSMFVTPSLITTVPGETASNLQIELLSALLRLQGMAASSGLVATSTTEPQPQAVPPASTVSTACSVGTTDQHGSVSTASANSAAPVSCKPETGEETSTGTSEVTTSSYSRYAVREPSGRNSMDSACPSSLLLHRLLTGEDANRVRSHSELILADSTREEPGSPVSESSSESVHETIIKPEADLTPGHSADGNDLLHQEEVAPLSLPVTAEPEQPPSGSQGPAASNIPTVALTMEQLVEVLREHYQALRCQNNKDALGQSSPKIVLNTALLKQLLPHLVVDSGASAQKNDTNKPPEWPNKTSTAASVISISIPVATGSLPAPVPTNQQMSNKTTLNSYSLTTTHDVACVTSQLLTSDLQDSDTDPKLAEFVSKRPRCHSDHQPNRRPLLNANSDPGRHPPQHQRSYLCCAQQRPRSFSKGERRCYNRLVRGGLCDSRVVSTDCDPNYSLIAKLVLTPEESWDSTTTTTTTTTLSNSSPATPTPSSTAKTVLTETGSKGTQFSSTASSPSSASSSVTSIGAVGSADERLQSPATRYTCSPTDCHQALRWLHESDVFVAQYCLGIPPGSLMTTVHSFDMHASHRYQALPKETQDTLNRMWPQLLLISMVEKRFTFSVTSADRQNYDQKPSVCGGLPVDLACTSSRSIGNISSSNSSQRNKLSSGYQKDAPSRSVVDGVVVDQLRRLVADGACLDLDSEIYHLMRLTVLAQSAYPNHFTHSYVDQLSDLELKLTTDAVGTTTTESKDAAVSRLVGTLRLLNHLHSIDPARLLSLFNIRVTASGDNGHSQEEIQYCSEDVKDARQPKSHNAPKSGSPIKHQQFSDSNTTSSSSSLATVLVGAPKRKATTVNRRRFGSVFEETPRQQTLTTRTVEPVLRCRANTFAGDNATSAVGCSRQCKTARLS